MAEPYLTPFWETTIWIRKKERKKKRKNAIISGQFVVLAAEQKTHSLCTKIIIKTVASTISSVQVQVLEMIFEWLSWA